MGLSKPNFDKENFPFGEFGITEESIITGVVRYIVGLGYSQYEYREIIDSILTAYCNMGFIKVSNVYLGFRRNMGFIKVSNVHLGFRPLSLKIITENKTYEFGPDGREYHAPYHALCYYPV